jgi:hypothetical protein
LCRPSAGPALTADDDPVDAFEGELFLAPSPPDDLPNLDVTRMPKVKDMLP